MLTAFSSYGQVAGQTQSEDLAGRYDKLLAAEYILYYKMYERVTNLCNILNLTNIINTDSCEKVI